MGRHGPHRLPAPDRHPARHGVGRRDGRDDRPAASRSAAPTAPTTACTCRCETVEDYGLLAHQRLDDMLAGGGEREVVGAERKRHPADFVLWKLAKPGEPSWPSPWGDGRPGWHSECVVMSLDLLGEGFDLHCGGLDLKFPHHENERAQAVALGKRFANHWMHHAFVVDRQGEKMSKTLGNFDNLLDFAEQHDPRSFRLLLLQATTAPRCRSDAEAGGRGRADARRARRLRPPAARGRRRRAGRRRAGPVPRARWTTTSTRRARWPSCSTPCAGPTPRSTPGRRCRAARRRGARDDRRRRPRARRRRRGAGRRRRAGRRARRGAGGQGLRRRRRHPRRAAGRRLDRRDDAAGTTVRGDRPTVGDAATRREPPVRDDPRLCGGAAPTSHRVAAPADESDRPCPARCSAAGAPAVRLPAGPRRAAGAVGASP